MTVLSPAAREVAAAVRINRSPDNVVELDTRVIMTAPVVPVTLAWIVSWTLVVGLFAPAVKVAMAWPPTSVTPPFRGTSVAPLWLPRSVNATVCPEEGTPEPSVTVALMMVLLFAERDVESAVKLILNPTKEAELDNRVMMTAPMAPVTLA